MRLEKTHKRNGGEASAIPRAKRYRGWMIFTNRTWPRGIIIMIIIIIIIIIIMIIIITPRITRIIVISIVNNNNNNNNDNNNNNTAAQRGASRSIRGDKGHAGLCGVLDAYTLFMIIC